MITRSPTLISLTADHTSTTSPTASWPRIMLWRSPTPPLVDRVDVGGAGSQGDRCADRVMRARDGVLLLDPSGPADPEHRVALHGRLLPRESAAYRPTAHMRLPLSSFGVHRRLLISPATVRSRAPPIRARAPEQSIALGPLIQQGAESGGADAGALRISHPNPYSSWHEQMIAPTRVAISRITH